MPAIGTQASVSQYQHGLDTSAPYPDISSIWTTLSLVRIVDATRRNDVGSFFLGTIYKASQSQEPRGWHHMAYQASQ